ncbi:hypothetical protein, partial [Nonomuraea sp. MG754425]|uniref:hypothetical protein n=1 Tax=Nonomuraea sp. MG754425 TaxID=2570319 RepID=UPI001F24A1DF
WAARRGPTSRRRPPPGAGSCPCGGSRRAARSGGRGRYDELSDGLDDDLDGPGGPRPQPILPLTTDSRTSSAATPWPLASPDDLREQSRDLSHDIGRSRLTALPGATPRTGKSRRRVEDDGGSWVRDGRP